LRDGVLPSATAKINRKQCDASHACPDGAALAERLKRFHDRFPGDDPGDLKVM
jgi:hypothetical protein